MSSRAGSKTIKVRAPSPSPSGTERKAFKAIAKAERKEKAQERDSQAGLGERNETQAEGTQARNEVRTATFGGRPFHVAGTPVHGMGDSRELGPDAVRADQGLTSPRNEEGEATRKASRTLVVDTQPGLIDRKVIDRAVGLLMDRRRTFARIVKPALIAGFEAEWHKSVGAALQDLEAEFKTGDLLGCYAEMSAMGNELFLRELQSKAVRILAHKKRKSKSKTTCK
jgi:hypothetical protein